MTADCVAPKTGKGSDSAIIMGIISLGQIIMAASLAKRLMGAPARMAEISGSLEQVAEEMLALLFLVYMDRGNRRDTGLMKEDTHNDKLMQSIHAGDYHGCRCIISILAYDCMSHARSDLFGVEFITVKFSIKSFDPFTPFAHSHALPSNSGNKVEQIVGELFLYIKIQSY